MSDVQDEQETEGLKRIMALPIIGMKSQVKI